MFVRVSLGQRQKRIRILFGIRIRIHGDTGISVVFVLYSYSLLVHCKTKYLYTLFVFVRYLLYSDLYLYSLPPIIVLLVKVVGVHQSGKS